mmetsp:Transcript_65828/g.189439  ORF Transcript_65828/g.189439 Transcript_65828/m.189439 type:complete len:83 (-) Transcript_65828:2279-2527(-)
MSPVGLCLTGECEKSAGRDKTCVQSLLFSAAVAATAAAISSIENDGSALVASAKPEDKAVEESDQRGSEQRPAASISCTLAR